MKKEFKIIMPSMPNFLRIDMGEAGDCQGGFKELPCISVGALSDEELLEFANEWKEAFMTHALVKRGQGDNNNSQINNVL